MKDLISVIVPIYNVESYLERCLDSIINQTYQNLEILLIDDGSTDRSLNICYKYQTIDARIKVYHKENGGLSSARNYGLKHCNAKYISFVDSDDVANHKMLEKLYNNLKNTDSELSICSVYSFKNEVELKKIKDQKIVISTYKNNDKFYKLLNDKDLDSILISNKLYKKELFKNIAFPEDKIHEDAFVMHHIIDGTKKMVYTNEKLFYYFIRSDSISHTFSLKRLNELEAVYERMCFFKQKRFKNTNYYELAHKDFIGYLIIYYYLLNFYNDDNHEIIKIIKNEYNQQYISVMKYKLTLYEKFKYRLVRYFPKLYLFLKRIRDLKK